MLKVTVAEVQRDVIKQLGVRLEALIDAYDNTIAYTDHVLAATAGWLQRREDYDTAMLYVADHGESLGENNLYLHGLPYALAPQVQKQVPWVTWLSPAFERRAGVTLDCLRPRSDGCRSCSPPTGA